MHIDRNHVQGERLHSSLDMMPPTELLPPRPLRKTRLERLPLSEITTAMLCVVNHVSALPLDPETIPVPEVVEGTQEQLALRKGFHALWWHMRTDPLYRNSLFNMASTFLLGGLGFVFWIIIARLYQPEYVGIATTLISIMTLLGNVTILGLNSSLNRYLPKAPYQHERIHSSFALVTAASILASTCFLLGVHIFSPQLVFLRSHPLYIFSFLLFIIFCSWNTLVESVAMAFRAAEIILLKNALISLLKLVLPFTFLALGSYGIFASTASALSLGVLVALLFLLLKFRIKPAFMINIAFLKETLAYSFANYINGFMLNMPSLVLPIILLNGLSSSYAAYFYIASMLQNILLIIPLATAQSLLTEGAYNEVDLPKHTKKALITIFVLLVPATAVIVFFGNFLLQFFGKSYASEALPFLQLYSLSTLFTALLLVANAVMNITHRIKLLVLTNTVAALLTLALASLFISGKLIGVGWGWMIGQALAGVFALGFVLRPSSTHRGRRRA
ncbi:lipopolysaccharide biosynthesis protein [Reticulibacter mediterranei]|nr:oligosaccharide flippase family protein [Reticulibacter mediterranei]